MSPAQRARRELAFSALLFLVALLPRLYVAIAWAKEPVWDGHYYDFGARRIADGLGYSDDAVVRGVLSWHPWCHFPVGYSALLALGYRLFGRGPHTGPVLNAALGALVAALVHRLALRALPPARARLAGLVVALSPELIVYAALLMTEPAASLAPVAAALVAMHYRDRRGPQGALLAGALLGLGTLVRPQTLLGAPGLFLVFLEKGKAARAAGLAALATLACLGVVAPWTARNCRVMDGCALVSTNGGWNLAIGALPRATGRFETIRASDGCAVVTGQVEQDRCWARVALQNIGRDPLRWLALAPRKLSFTFDHASFPMGYLGEADPGRFTDERRDRGRRLLGWAHRALLAAAAFSVVSPFWRLRGRERAAQAALFSLLALVSLGLFGLAFRDEPSPFWWLAAAPPLIALVPLPGAPRRGPVVSYLLFTVASVALTHAVFFGEDRYHVFLTPLFALLAAAALGGEAQAPPPSAGPAGEAGRARGFPSTETLA